MNEISQIIHMRLKVVTETHLLKHVNPFSCSHVRAQLHVYSRLFVLSATDEWTYKFMGAHPEQYAKSDFNSVMDHLADVVGQVQSRADVEKPKGAFLEQDKTGAGCLTPDDMAAAFARGGVDVNKRGGGYDLPEAKE